MAQKSISNWSIYMQFLYALMLIHIQFASIWPSSFTVTFTVAIYLVLVHFCWGQLAFIKVKTNETKMLFIAWDALN